MAHLDRSRAVLGSFASFACGQTRLAKPGANDCFRQQRHTSLYATLCPTVSSGEIVSSFAPTLASSLTPLPFYEIVRREILTVQDHFCFARTKLAGSRPNLLDKSSSTSSCCSPGSANETNWLAGPTRTCATIGFPSSSRAGTFRDSELLFRPSAAAYPRSAALISDPVTNDPPGYSMRSMLQFDARSPPLARASGVRRESLLRQLATIGR